MWTIFSIVCSIYIWVLKIPTQINTIIYIPPFVQIRIIRALSIQVLRWWIVLAISFVTCILIFCIELWVQTLFIALCDWLIFIFSNDILSPFLPLCTRNWFCWINFANYKRRSLIFFISWDVRSTFQAKYIIQHLLAVTCPKFGWWTVLATNK